MTNKSAEKSPRDSAEYEVNQAIKAVMNTAKSYGLDSMLLGFKTKEGLTTTHMEHLPAATGFNIIIALFNQLCDFESTLPGNTPDHTKAIEQLRSDFIAAIKSYNQHQSKL